MSATPTIPQVLNCINGCWSPGSSSDVISVVNPATGAELTRYASASTDDVDRAVAAARAAAPRWSALTTGERSDLIFDLAAAFAAHLEELCALEVADVGKPVTSAAGEEFPLMLGSIRFFAAAARSLTSPSAGEYVPGVTTLFIREPVGVVAAIAPWNYPLWMAIWKVVPALVTGNTVVLKPAETTPLSTTRFVELAARLLPPGVLNLVQGHGAVVGDHLAHHPGVDLVSFTGSIATGRAIAAAGAARPRRSVLELGGNAPVVILDDADLPDAAATVAAMALLNGGQECMAATRVIVDQRVEAAFTELLLAEIDSVVLGDPTDARTTLGPLVSEEHLAKVSGLVDRRPDTSKLLVGGQRADRPGYYYEPTVISGLSQGDELVQQEIFGPVITIQSFDDPAAAIEMANGVDFGLAASVWTNNMDRGLEVSRAFDFGSVWVNTHLVVGLDFPLGGFNESGYGKEGGIAGIEEFTRLKSIGIRSTRTIRS